MGQGGGVSNIATTGGTKVQNTVNGNMMRDQWNKFREGSRIFWNVLGRSNIVAVARCDP